MLCLIGYMALGYTPLCQANTLQAVTLEGNFSHKLQLLPHSELWSDPEGSLSAEDILGTHSLNAIKINPRQTYISLDGGVYWLHFRVQNLENQIAQYWLSFDTIIINHLQLYKYRTSQLNQSPHLSQVSEGGLLYLNPGWDRQERSLTLPISLDRHETASFLLRLEHPDTYHLSPSLQSNHSFIDFLTRENIHFGARLGLLIVLFIFGLNLYLSLRNRACIYYIIYITALFLQIASLGGLFKVTIPGALAYNGLIGAIGTLLNWMAGALFTRYFLGLPGRHPKTDKLILITGFFPVILFSILPLFSISLELPILISALLIQISICVASIIRLREKYYPAVFILVSSLLLLVPLSALFLAPKHVIELLAEYQVLHSAAIIKALILGFGLTALVDRLNKQLSTEVDERQARESQLVHAQRVARYGDWSWDTKNNVFHFSESALDILPNLAKQGGNYLEKLLEHASPKQRRIIQVAFNTAARDKHNVDTEFSLLHDDGSTHYYLSRAEFQKNAQGQITSTLIGTIHDITDSKLADLAYKENEKRWRELADSTFEAIIIYHQNIIIDANMACEQLLGYKPAELIGTSGNFFIKEESLKTLLQVIAEASNKPVEMTLKNRAGKDTVVEFRSRSGSFNQLAVQIVAIRDITERKLQEEQLVKLGYYDSLTGLANRSLFQERLQHAIDKAQRHKQMHALLFIDLDQFKHVNDSLGHDVGDKLLIDVGRRLKERVRRNDTVARLGGDEFAILLEDISAPYAAAKVADEVLRIMSEPVEVDEYQLKVTPSIGIAMHPSDGESIKELLRKADTAMYHAKAQGRNNYQFYTDILNERMVRRMSIESDLRLAVENKTFTLHYQPKVDISSGAITGAEALLRWHSEKFGWVSPEEFIAIAEETGLIWPIGEFALEEACRQAKLWQTRYAEDFTIAVNISGIQFTHINLVETVATVAERTGIQTDSLELEITEGAIINNAEDAIEVMSDLKRLGVKLSLDDFGTGYSSLNYLKRFPVDSLKIDRSFIAEIVDDSTGKLIADNIIKLAHALELTIVAEGVETVEQLNMIAEMGCDELQGYIFSRPLPTEEFEALLTQGHNLYKQISKTGTH